MRWQARAAVERPRPDGDRSDDLHVMPTYGRQHETTVLCWCQPERDHDAPAVVVHRDLN